MTVVWSTVKNHGGYIDLHRREGEGSHFDIFLPATRDLPSQREARFV
jgi:signal transduction histidine kinase